MSILHLIYTLFPVVIYGTCFMSLCFLVFSVVQHVSNFEYNREMTPKKKRLKQTMIDHYLYEKEGYKSD